MVDGGRWVLAPRYDWNTFFTVKDQGSKIVCFAIFVISIVESLYKIIYGNDITIELEEILYYHPHNFSNGGLSDFCLGYLMTHGICSKRPKNKIITIDGFVRIPGFNERYLLVAVAHQPVIAHIKVGQIFQN